MKLILLVFVSFCIYSIFCKDANHRDRRNLQNDYKKEKMFNTGIELQPGRPFPMPQSIFRTETQHYLDARAFSFQYVPGSATCSLLSTAFNRYYKIIFTPGEYETARKVLNLRKSNKMFKKNFGLSDQTQLKRVVVNVHEPCEEYPTLESDESCNLN
jgi:hypothetical protein